MTTTSATPGVAPRVGAPIPGPSPTLGRWIDDWRPEDPEFWNESGRKVARRNLAWSIFAEHLGFSVWLIWSVSSAFLPGRLRLLTAAALPARGPPQPGRLPAPAAVHVRGAEVRWPQLDGGQRGPAAGPDAGVRVRRAVADTPYWLFCLIAATAGLGGGNFASSMANINFFYPAAKKGAALGLNAAAATSASR